MDPRTYDGARLEPDRVLTPTAAGTRREPLDAGHSCLTRVDGDLRDDRVPHFLRTSGIAAPDAGPEAPSEWSVQALGMRKEAVLRALLHQRRHRSRRIHHGRGQQRVHQPHGQGEPQIATRVIEWLLGADPAPHAELARATGLTDCVGRTWPRRLASSPRLRGPPNGGALAAHGRFPRPCARAPTRRRAIARGVEADGCDGGAAQLWAGSPLLPLRRRPAHPRRMPPATPPARRYPPPTERGG